MTLHAPLRRAALVAVLALSGAVVAFATLAPSPEAEATLLQRAIVEPVALRAADAVLPAPAARPNARIDADENRSQKIQPDRRAVPRRGPGLFGCHLACGKHRGFARRDPAQDRP
jgi:hypothetical protein